MDYDPDYCSLPLADVGERIPSTNRSATAALTKLGWPKVQIKHFLKSSKNSEVIQAGAEPQEKDTTVYFGSQYEFDRERMGTNDEVTNPVVALEIFATSFGSQEGFVMVLDKVPRDAIRSRMNEGDTALYEQASAIVPEKAEDKHAGDFAKYQVPSRQFREILEACCRSFIKKFPDPDTGLDVHYINPAFADEVNYRILREVRKNPAYQIKPD